MLSMNYPLLQLLQMLKSSKATCDDYNDVK